MATEYPPLGKSFVLSYANNDRDFPIIAIRKDPRVENYKIPEDLSPHPDSKRYPNHVFTGAQPTNSDERVQWIYEILPAPWVPFTRYDDDLGPIQGRRRSVKNEGQVASLTPDKRTTYEAREGSAIVYTEIEESWSIATDDDGNSLFPVKDRDTYNDRLGAVKERRQLLVPTGEEQASLEYKDPTIIQTTYEPYNEYLSFKVVTSYDLSGPIRREDIYDSNRGPVQRLSQVIYDSGNLEGSLVRQGTVVTQTSYQPINNLVVDRVIETYSVNGPLMQGRMIDGDGNLATLSRQVVATGTEADSGYKITSSSISPENKEIGIKQTVRVDEFPVLSGAQIDPRYGVVLQYTKELVDASTAVGGVNNLESVEIEPKNQWHSWKLTTRISQLPDDQIWYGYRKESFPDVLTDLKIVGTETYQPVPSWRVAPDTPLRARYTRKFTLGPPQEPTPELSPLYWAEPFYIAIEYLRVSQSESSTTSNSTSSGTNTSTNNSVSNVVSDGTQQSINSSNSQSSSTSNSYQESSGTGTSTNRSESNGTNESSSRSNSFTVSNSNSTGTSQSQTASTSSSVNYNFSQSNSYSESSTASNGISDSLSVNTGFSENDGASFSLNYSLGDARSSSESQTESEAKSTSKSEGTSKTTSKTTSESSVESTFESNNTSENKSTNSQTGTSTSNSKSSSVNTTITESESTSISSGISSGTNSNSSRTVSGANNYTSIESTLSSNGDSHDVTSTSGSGTTSRSSIYQNSGQSSSFQTQRNDSNQRNITDSSFSGSSSQSSESSGTSNTKASTESTSNSESQTTSEYENESSGESTSNGESKSTNKSTGENSSESSVQSEGTSESSSKGTQNSTTINQSSTKTDGSSYQNSYNFSKSTNDNNTTSSSTSSSVGNSYSESSTDSNSYGSSNSNNSSTSSSTSNNETTSTSDTTSVGSSSGIQNTNTSSTSSSISNGKTVSNVSSSSTSDSSGQTQSTNNSTSSSTSSGTSSSVNFSTSQNSTTSTNKSIFNLTIPKCLRENINVNLPSGESFVIPATRQTDLNWGSYIEVARQSEHWKQGIWITEITEVYLPEI